MEGYFVVRELQGRNQKLANVPNEVSCKINLLVHGSYDIYKLYAYFKNILLKWLNNPYSIRGLNMKS